MMKKHFIVFALLFLSITFTPFNFSIAQQNGRPSQAGDNNKMTVVDTKATDEKIKEFQQLSNEERLKFLETLSEEDKVKVFEALSGEEKTNLFKRLDNQSQIRVFHKIKDDDKTILFQSLDQSEKQLLFNILTGEDRKKVFSSLSTDEQEDWLKIYPQLRERKTEERRPGAAPGRYALSETETIMSGQFPLTVSRELRQFGYDFFAEEAPSFAPLENIPVGPDYVIGPGDNFLIHLWGRAEMTYNVTVTRDGQIKVPRLGLIMVSGLTFAELKQHLYRKFRQFYPDFKMSITMGALRTIQVYVVGEARKPGTFSLSSLSTVITALYAAGGPTKNGTLRKIRVLRKGNLINEVDLYDFFVTGIKTADTRLQPGDTVFIPVIGEVVGVAGNVRRPAIYELKGTQNIGEALDLAGGVLPTGELQNVVVERIEGHNRRVIKSYNVDPSDAMAYKNLRMTLMDGDIVKIYPVHQMIRQVVYLEGHVKYPREYELRAGMNLRDLIPAYNALLPEPYLPQAEILRLMPPDLHPEIIEFDLGALLSGDETQNLMLQDQDRVKIYSRWEKSDIPLVTIKGAVREPGTYRLYKGMTVKDLIFRAGNLTDKAYLKKADLTRIVNVGTGTETIKLNFSPKTAMKGVVNDNPVLRNNDFVHIREIPQYKTALKRKVYLDGEFVFPGEFSYSEGERLSSAIERAGGFNKQAYPFGAYFLRESVKKIQQVRLNQYISKLERDILSISSVTAEKALSADEANIIRETLEAKTKLLEKLKRSEPTGRMVINLEEVLLMPNSPQDIVLQPGDRLVVSKKPASVNVIGEVYNPTALLFEQGMTVDYYLNMVGGPAEEADTKRMYLVKANGTVISRSQEGFFGLSSWDPEKKRWTIGGGFDSIKLNPGDTILVPQKIKTYPWLRIVKDVTQILANVALTAGVIIAAMDR